MSSIPQLPPDYETPQFQRFIESGVVFMFCNMLYRVAMADEQGMVLQIWDWRDAWHTISKL